MIREGTRVQWDWGDGVATGKVSERHEERVEKEISGSRVVRNGTSDDAALLIEQDDGQRVLKLQSEVERAD